MYMALELLWERGEHACLHASTPESNARQISPKNALLLTL